MNPSIISVAPEIKITATAAEYSCFPIYSHTISGISAKRITLNKFGIVNT